MTGSVLKIVHPTNCRNSVRNSFDDMEQLPTEQPKHESFGFGISLNVTAESVQTVQNVPRQVLNTRNSFICGFISKRCIRNVCSVAQR